MLRVLHIEDDPIDAELIYRSITEGVPCSFWRVTSKAGLFAALSHEHFDLIISDSSLPEIDGVSAMKLAKNRFPNVPFVFCSGHLVGDKRTHMLNLGAFEFFCKTDIGGLISLVENLHVNLINTETSSQNF